MSAITIAAASIDEISAKANCEHRPEVRIVFVHARDQYKFRQQIAHDMDPGQTEMIRNLTTSNRAEVYGITIKLMNTDRGDRATAERIIKTARDAFNAADRSPRMNVDMILKMKLALNDLLRLVEGPTT